MVASGPTRVKAARTANQNRGAIRFRQLHETVAMDSRRHRDGTASDGRETPNARTAGAQPPLYEVHAGTAGTTDLLLLDEMG